MAHLTLSVNISAREFGHPNFVTRILTIIDEIGADPRKLMLEFTERSMFGPVEETLVKMSALKARGVQFALDDFGIGFSSLASLKSLPLDQLKIDRSFVRDIPTNSSDAIIASAIIALGRSLGLSVIAEGVETEEQRQFLAHHGCHAYQGFLFGQPGAVGDLSSIARPRSGLELQTAGPS
jgi:EAL domain-containing protein (putative c-di-GMP-specific phosphodiesterase class I)